MKDKSGGMFKFEYKTQTMRRTTKARQLMLLSLCCLGILGNTFAQKKRTEPKLDKRKYAIEIREVSSEGKKYEKDVFEFTPKEIISDFVEAKLKVTTIHYKVITDSTYTDDGEELKYWKLTGREKTGKPEEELKCELIVSGKEISGTIKLMKGEAIKKTYEFEGLQNN
jgi:hypothetical protein